MNMRKIYRKIARKNGVSIKEVRQEMLAAIKEAYITPRNDNPDIKAYQNRVPRQNEIPTPEELIYYLSSQAGRQNS